MRKRLVWAVMVMFLLTTGIFSADAQPDLEEAQAAVTSATLRLETLVDDLEAAQRRGDELAGSYWQVESGLEKLDGEIADAAAVVDRLGADRAALRGEVRVIAVDRYVTGSDELGLTDHEAEADRAAAETLARLVVGADIGALDELRALAAEYSLAAQALEVQRREQQVALADVQATQEALFDELNQLTELRRDLDAELIALEDALGQLEAAAAQRQAEAIELERIAEARRRAAAAVAAAAEQARTQPPAATVVPQPTVPEPTVPEPTGTVVPNPQLPATVVPEPTPAEPTGTVVPNPQLPATVVPEPTPPEPTGTVVPNPQPSEPFPTATVVPNPQVPAVSVGAGAGPGGIVCPLQGAFTHTDDFSAPRQVGGIHRANDLISAQGTPVIAVASGMLEHKEASVGGLSAHLRGDNDDYYFYTHLSGYENVGAGRVAAGTVIGYVGMTGNAPIPHLHFEIHQGGYGNYVNPYGPVRAACF